MPYFFILPLYVLLVAVVLVAAAVFRLQPRFRYLSPYLVAGAIGSLPGMLIGNLLLVAVVAPFVTKKIVLPDQLYWLSALIVGAGVLVGPFVVSAAGSVIGAALGWRFCRTRMMKNREPNQPVQTRPTSRPV